MTIRSFAALLLVFAACMSVVACGSPTSATTVSTVVVAGTAPAVGFTTQFTATAMLASGTSQDVTSTAAWTSSNTAVATVSSTGAVTAVATGTAVITATYSGIAGTDAVTVP